MIINNVCLLFIKKYLNGKILDVGATESSLMGNATDLGVTINGDVTTLDIEQPTDIIHDLDKFPYPLSDNSFDVVFCGSVLEHLEAPYIALKELNRILKKDGILIVGLPNPHYILSKTDKGKQKYKY